MNRSFVVGGRANPGSSGRHERDALATLPSDLAFF
jgi:hypothetical protein